MRLTRCYVDAPLAIGEVLRLPEEKSLHLLRVLRLGVGDALSLFNGDGHDYRGVLRSAEKKSAEVDVLDCQPVLRESPLRIVLLQGIARGEKMDLILQKATELGAAEIWPVSMERTEVKLDAERGEKRLQHWRGVIAAACEQSGRAVLPLLAEPLSLGDALLRLPTDTHRLTLDPVRGQALRSLALGSESTVVVAVGPEGGLGERDLRALGNAGFSGLRLGPRILRTETAGLAVVAALQAQYGDWT